MAETAENSTSQMLLPYQIPTVELTCSQSETRRGPMTTTQQKRKQPAVDDDTFPFMKLPSEIRTMIYKELLIMDGLIVLGRYSRTFRYPRTFVAVNTDEVVVPLNDPHSFEKLDPPVDQLILVNFFTVSRTIYREAFHIYFHHNSFYFNDTWHLARFLSRMGPNYRRSLHTLELWYTGKTPARAMKLLTRCVGLRRLTIFVDGYLTRNTQLDLMKLHGMNDLFKLRGIKHLDLKEVPRLALCESDERQVAWSAFKDALQVLKQPHTATQLKRREKEDYPQEARNLISGKINGKVQKAQ